MPVERVASENGLAQVYEELLEPHFGPEELIELRSLVDGVAEGAIEVLAQREGDAWLGVAIGDFAPGVTLLSYLAVSSAARGRGVGSTLLEAAIAAWTGRVDSGDLVVAEVEDPRHHESHPLRGDPTRRLAFYARHGARVLDVPYFQPSLREGTPRVPHMLLVVLAVRAPLLSDDGGALSRTAPLVAMLEDYFEGAEGVPRPPDTDAVALFQALESGPISLLNAGGSRPE